YTVHDELSPSRSQCRSRRCPATHAGPPGSLGDGVSATSVSRATVHPARVDQEPWELRQLKHSIRWTIYVPRAMKEELQRRAGARGVNASILVQEALARR